MTSPRPDLEQMQLDAALDAVRYAALTAARLGAASDQLEAAVRRALLLDHYTDQVRQATQPQQHPAPAYAIPVTPGQTYRPHAHFDGQRITIDLCPEARQTPDSPHPSAAPSPPHSADNTSTAGAAANPSTTEHDTAGERSQPTKQSPDTTAATPSTPTTSDPHTAAATHEAEHRSPTASEHSSAPPNPTSSSTTGEQGEGQWIADWLEDHGVPVDKWQRWMLDLIFDDRIDRHLIRVGFDEREGGSNV